MHGDQELFTYEDAVEHLISYAGRDAGDSTRRDARRAAVEALRELRTCHEWSVYYKTGRITTSASYGTGTIAYDHTGGTYERSVTLTGGTWPDDAARGEILISNVPYRVDSRESDTVITLNINSNPGADVASGTTYNLYRDTYTLPLNFGKFQSELVDVANKWYISFTHPKRWLATSRSFLTPARPHAFTTVGSDDYMGAVAVKFGPPPNAVNTYDFVYARTARRLIHEQVNAGTVSTSSTAVTGSGTAFTADMVGAVIRVSSGSTAPTNQFGSNPFTEERIITAYTSATSVTVDEAFDASHSGVKYVISDPVDLDIRVMLNAYLRTCEKRLASLRHAGDAKQVQQDWAMELKNAQAADNRMKATRQVGGRGRFDYGSYLAEVATLGSDIS